MTQRRVPLWLYLNIALVAALSLFSLYFRFHVEQRNRAVAIAAEMDVVESLAAAQGLTPKQALRELKVQGLNAVVLPEEYVAELVSQGQIQIQNGKFITGNSEAVQRVLRGVKMRFPEYANNGSFAGSGTGTTAVQFPDVNLVRGVAIGLNPIQSDTARSEGLIIVARCANPTSANEDTVVQTLAWAKDLGASIFLPSGEQVLGRRDALDTTIESLRKFGMIYASPEFAKIGGDENLVEKAPDVVVRLHSAQAQELDKLRLEEAVDRYSRAARERNQHLLLLRPISNAAPKPLDAFGEFIQKVKKETEKQGSVIGIPHPFEEPPIKPWLFTAIGFSLVPIVLWTAAAFVRRRFWLIAIGLLVALIAAACYPYHGKTMGTPFMALIAALTLPTTAFLILDGRNVRFLMWEYLVTSLVSFTGGLAVAGLLNGLPYYIHAQQFMGVKFAHFAPILLIGIYFFYRFGLVKKSLNSPVEWGKALLALVVLAGLGFMIARTGNDNPAAVSSTELKLRDLLDVVLFVRPRTKEFMIGHPFLILGIGMLISLRRDEKTFANWKGWITLFLMLGAIGQTSIVNTMCHIHTPLVLSVERLGVGLLAGGIIGAVLWGVVKRLAVRFSPSEGQ